VIHGSDSVENAQKEIALWFGGEWQCCAALLRCSGCRMKHCMRTTSCSYYRRQQCLQDCCAPCNTPAYTEHFCWATGEVGGARCMLAYYSSALTHCLADVYVLLLLQRTWLIGPPQPSPGSMSKCILLPLPHDVRSEQHHTVCVGVPGQQQLQQQRQVLACNPAWCVAMLCT
jgi:hypothetical protein